MSRHHHRDRCGREHEERHGHCGERRDQMEMASPIYIAIPIGSMTSNRNDMGWDMAAPMGPMCPEECMRRYPGR